MSKKFYVRSKIINPYYNLALEDYYLSYINEYPEDEAIYGLFLWQNDKTVVIGKNQCLERECNLDLIKSNNISIARRYTGGGAVYHDLGNLNFSFFTSSRAYSLEDNFKIIQDALLKFGIVAVRSGRNDLLVDNKKMSGNAFRKKENAVLHHGTILVSGDIEFASKCLTPDSYKLKSKGIASVKSRICNVSDYSEQCNIEKLINEIEHSFNMYYEQNEIIEIQVDSEFLKIEENKLKDTNWINRVSPANQYILHTQDGTIRFLIREMDGKIETVEFEADVLNADSMSDVMSGLVGVKLNLDSIRNYFTKCKFETEVPNTILDLLTQKIVMEITDGKI